MTLDTKKRQINTECVVCIKTYIIKLQPTNHLYKQLNEWILLCVNFSFKETHKQLSKGYQQEKVQKHLQVWVELHADMSPLIHHCCVEIFIKIDIYVSAV